MIDKVKQRLAAEQGFTLIELLVVIVILGILVAIAVPSYLSFRGKAQTAAAEANVRSAIPAAESYYNGTGNNSYNGLTGATLRTEAPGVSQNVKAVASSGHDAYCIQDSEDSGTTYYSYLGGNAAATGVTLAAGKKAATIQLGDCATDTGLSGAA